MALSSRWIRGTVAAGVVVWLLLLDFHRRHDLISRTSKEEARTLEKVPRRYEEPPAGSALGVFHELTKHNNTACPFSPNRGYALPKKQLGDFSGNHTVYLVGDSVIGQLCLLGRPGLCCNGRGRFECDIKPRFNISNPKDLAAWIRRHAKDKEYLRKLGFVPQDWQHLSECVARGGGHAPVYHVAPNTEARDGGIGVISRFLESQELSDDNVLIAGLMGNHYSSDAMDKYDLFTKNFIQKIVNPFPGRVVLIGASPQHYGASGAYEDGHLFTECKPTDPSVMESRSVALRSAIWAFNGWKYLKHDRSQVVDVQQFLARFWMCHRVGQFQLGTDQKLDCTHWEDGVYSILAAVVLRALGEIE